MNTRSLRPLLLLIVAVTTFALLAGCRYTPKPPKEITILNDGYGKFTLIRGMPVVETWINGQGPYHMILDTGANAVVVSDKIKKEAGLRWKRFGLGRDSSGKESLIHGVEIQSLRIAGAEFGSITGMVVKWNEDLQKIGIDGAIGADVFQNCSLLIHGPEQNYIVKNRSVIDDDDNDALPYASAGDVRPLLAMKASLADKPQRSGLVLLDTGFSRGLELPRSFGPDLPAKSASTQSRTAGVLVTHPVEIYKTAVSVTFAERFTIDFDHVEIAQDDKGTIGNYALSQLHLVLDGQKRKLKLIPGEHLTKPSPMESEITVPANTKLQSPHTPQNKNPEAWSPGNSN